MEKWLAHVSEDGARVQTVRAHLEGTAERAAGFAAAFGAEEPARLAGLLHDIGKFTPAFQRRLLEQGPRVDHSTAGAKEAAALGLLPLSLCIAGHHGGLPDCGVQRAPEPGTLWARLDKPVEDYSAWREAGRAAPSRTPYPAYAGESLYSAAFFTRMLFSCLVDADWQDTGDFMAGEPAPRGGYPPMSALLEKLERHVEKWWASDRPINQKRCEILGACLHQGACAPPGLYTLTVPTGGGKTVSSLAFALRHAAEHGLERVIYVIPYTSIIEQNAQVFRDILGDENVVEHHSNVDYDIGEDQAQDPAAFRKALACENWDAPVVVTTAVQFFESLYANRPSRCRKLHSLAKSVIIFDEAQMLPVPYLRPCVAAIAELVKHYSATAVLCTATQPALDGLFHAIDDGLSIREICPDTAGLYQFFRRVTLERLGTLDDAALARRLNAHDQVLCIVNSRAQAKHVYDLLEGEGCYHLSTLMCPAHRRAILAEIRGRLDPSSPRPCRVVSTSLIEAGVDVDFPTVYRAEAGLDSILQAAGRCNRENRRPREESRVYVFTPQEDPPPLFAQNVAAFQVVAEAAELDAPETIDSYFRTLLTLKGEAALDQWGILDEPLSYRWTAEHFHLIGSQARTVYLPLGGGEALVERLRAGERSRKLFRALGQYAVNVYPQHFKALLEAGDLELLDEEAAVLVNPDLYGRHTGLSLEADFGKDLFV